MIRVRVGVDDLARVRFAVSPLRETVASLRTLTGPSAGLQLHRPWQERTRAALARSDVDLALLTTLVRPTGYVPDFLVPPPARRRTSLAAGLDLVRGFEPQEVGRQLRHLAGHPVAMVGPGRAEREDRLLRLARRPPRQRPWSPTPSPTTTGSPSRPTGAASLPSPSGTSPSAST